MSGTWWDDCRALSIAFANHVDHRRYDEVAALFTDDGVLNRSGQPVTGRAALRAWLDTRAADVVTRHVCTNFEARQVAPDRAEGFTLFTFYRAVGHDAADALPIPGLTSIGEYTDRFRLTPEGWRIAHRDIRIVFQVAA